MQHIVYLHGFLSSARSEKAQLTAQFINKHYPSANLHILELPGNIKQAKAKIDALVKTLPRQELRFIGSSMGGYLSTYCVETYGGKAAIINPAVEPIALLKNYLGKHINPYTGEIFYVTAHHLDTLAEIYQTELRHPENYLVLLQTGDETLDYRLAVNKYRNSHIILEQGGNHSFIGYERYLSKIIDHLR